MFLPLVTNSRSPTTLAPVVIPTSCLIEPRYSTLSEDTQSGPVWFAMANEAVNRDMRAATSVARAVRIPTQRTERARACALGERIVRQRDQRVGAPRLARRVLPADQADLDVPHPTARHSHACNVATATQLAVGVRRTRAGLAEQAYVEAVVIAACSLAGRCRELPGNPHL